MDLFYKKYYLGIKKFVQRRVGDEGEAEELVNDILMSGYYSKPTFNHQSSEFSWLCGIAKHKIVDYYRKRKMRAVIFPAFPVLEEVADKALGPEGEGLKNELKEEIKMMLREIGEGYGKILRLKYIEGWRVNEIAKILKISVKAAESKLIRAKAKFKKGWKYDY